MNPLRIHGICLALNEEAFIRHQLNTLYPFCSGISVLSQYDRDWYGNAVAPDRTVQWAIDFPDPEGKIHVVVRRWRDQAAALNCEMAAVASNAASRVQSHGSSPSEVRSFHQAPDYFLIVDADELYDVDTLPGILDFLAARRPRGMRVVGYNYARRWNRRVPSHVVPFVQFGFIRPGIRFRFIRVPSWTESRLSKVFRTMHVPDVSSRLFGFVTCPESVGVFHHGCWLGDDARLDAKISRSAHREPWAWRGGDAVDRLETVFVPTAQLPRNIRHGPWPQGYVEDESRSAASHAPVRR